MPHYIVGQGRARFIDKAERIPPTPDAFRPFAWRIWHRPERKGQSRSHLKGAALPTRGEGVSFYFEGSSI